MLPYSNPRFFSFYLKICGLHILHIFYNHQCNLKCDCILEYSQIQSCALLKFIQAVYQCISMNIQLSGCLRYIQTVLEEFINRRQCLLIKIISRFSTKNLTDKHLALVSAADRSVVQFPMNYRQSHFSHQKRSFPHPVPCVPLYKIWKLP